MPSQQYYSVRMHASRKEKHVSGAERIVTTERVDTVVNELIARARAKTAVPDHIVVTIDDLGSRAPLPLTALNVTTIPCDDADAGRALAERVLVHAGVASEAVSAAIRFLRHGASPSGNNMRGAMIMDALTGRRFEPDRERGVRASRFDWSDQAGREMIQRFEDNGLRHNRTYEAVALATKIARAPAFVAELCWSDDPDYTAGYAASCSTGYVRFPFLKKTGDPRGGRAIFINGNVFDLHGFIDYLEHEAVLIDKAGICRNETDFNSFLNRAGKHVRT
jgi:6-carboxyhexanoate--CoA ligase